MLTGSESDLYYAVLCGFNGSCLYFKGVIAKKNKKNAKTCIVIKK